MSKEVPSIKPTRNFQLHMAEWELSSPQETFQVQKLTLSIDDDAFDENYNYMLDD